MTAVNVVIADDHPVVLLGVREIVRRDGRYTVVGEAVSSSELIEQLRTHRPQLLITDFNMPGDATYGDRLKLIEYVLRNFPQTQILVLTMISNSLILSRLQELGVAGVIQKNHLHQEIEKALTALSRRRPYQSPSAEARSVMGSSAQVGDRFESLSPRELAISTMKRLAAACSWSTGARAPKDGLLMSERSSLRVRVDPPARARALGFGL